MAVLLLGSTGNGKSTLGNFLIDPKDEILFEKQIFKTAKTNMPETQHVQKKVFQPKKNTPKLAIIDTPGLNESDTHDLKHMIQIIDSLHEVDGVVACVLVVKFNSKIDAQYKATVKYYKKLLPSIFERNVIIVMTDYVTDARSVKLRERQGINVDQIKSNTVREIVESASLDYDPLLFLIDCLPCDDEERDLNLKERDAILGKISSQKPITTQSLMVAKTDFLKREDTEQIKGYEGEVTGYNIRLQQANTKAKEALEKTQSKAQEITKRSQEKNNLQAELDQKDSSDLTDVARWSISEAGKFLQWFSRSFEKTFPCRIDNIEKWDNNHCEWKINETEYKVSGTVEGEFMRGIYASLSLQSSKRSKYAKEIQSLKQQIDAVEKHKKSLLEHFRKIRDHYKDYTKEMKLLEEFIQSKRVMINALSSDYLTLDEARERLGVLEAKRREY